MSGSPDTGGKAKPIVKAWSPGITCLQWPDTSRFANPIVSINRLIVWLSIECEVGMGIEYNPVCIREDVYPHRQRLEPVVNSNVWSIACAITSNAPYYVVSVEITTRDRNKIRQWRPYKIET
jgi:hypothetical protein